MDIITQVDSKFWTKGRLETFGNWPFQSSDNACNPKRMAAAGFVAIGGSDEPDLVECFICFKQLDGWDPDDDPWDEHAKHMPSCPYVRLNKQDMKSWTIEELYNLLKEYYVNHCMHNMQKLVDKAEEEALEMVKQIPKIHRKLRKSRKETNQSNLQATNL